MRVTENLIVLKLSLVLLASSLFDHAIQGQTGDAIRPPPEWVRVHSKHTDFSIGLPSDSWIFNAEDEVPTLYRYVRAARIFVAMESNTSRKNSFKRWSHTWWTGSEYNFFEVDDFFFVQRLRKVSGQYVYAWMYFVSPKGAYTVSVYSRDSESELYRAVFSTIRLNDKPIFSFAKGTPSTTSTISFDTLTPDPLVKQALKVPDSTQSKLIDSTGYYFQLRPPVELDTLVDSDKDVEYSRDLIILKRWKTDFLGPVSVQLHGRKVRIAVKFLATGMLGDIELLESSRDRTVDTALFRAARKIKFLPAMVDGKPVDVKREFEHQIKVAL